MPRVIVVSNWDDFQHYKDRDPTWVKLYRDLLTSESWVLGTDASRLVQVACILLAARYHNATPLKYDMFRKVANLDVSAKDFAASVEHLLATKFLEIHGDDDTEQVSASDVLASCTSEKRREEKSREEEIKNYAPQERDRSVEIVFDHWRNVHGHPRAKLDAKRRKVIKAALASYSPDDLCEAISGYQNSPHHMGVNDRSTRYDDIELFLRDAKHIDAGLAFARGPATTVSKLTAKNITAVADWVPPEMRNATG